MNINKIFIFILIPLLFISESTFAWFGTVDIWYDSTHEEIGNDAVNLLTQADYPDLYQFIEQIRDGSETETHNQSEELTISSYTHNGGYPKTWWDIGKDKYNNSDNVIHYYKSYLYDKAYKTIGRMCHLIQDMAVPTHAANILHGIDLTGGDNIELSAFFNYDHDTVTTITGYVNPDEYYQPLQDLTRGKLSSWLKPGTTYQYWVQNATAVPLGQDCTLPVNGEYVWGHYGGPDNTDVYAYSDNSGTIINSQIGDAVRYTAGALKAASELLPPLIEFIDITPVTASTPTINTQTGSIISIMMYENRVQDVKLHITVDGQDGIAIISSAYGADSGVPLVLESGTSLPWKKCHEITWDGKLANGEYPTNGEHTLYVVIEDDDGNFSDYATHQFNICPDWEMHIIGAQQNPVYIFSKDIDGDGDLDIASSTNQHPGLQPSEVAWWQNRINEGLVWQKIIIRSRTDTGHVDGATGIIIEDIDRDGRQDIISASGLIGGAQGKVCWFKAPADPTQGGSAWQRFEVESNDNNTLSKIYTLDANEDGWSDLAVAGTERAILLLNPGDFTDPSALWVKQDLPDDTAEVGMFLDDWNGDSSTDIMACRLDDSGSVSWVDVSCHEGNVTFTRYEIDDGNDNPFDVCTLNIDGDGKKDLVVSELDKSNLSGDTGRIFWYEAPATTGGTWTQHTVTNNSRAADLYPGDIDGDGRDDFVVAVLFDYKVSWFKNELVNGEIVWTEYVVEDDVDLPGDIELQDLDNDGDLDIVTNYSYGHKMLWYENNIQPPFPCLTKEIYGEHSQKTELLRHFRDNILSRTPEGQEIIRLYYEWSPSIVKAMEGDEEFKEDIKEMIDGVLELIEGEAE